MAQQLPCDLCNEEGAVVMFNDLVTGGSMTVGATCLPLFFGGAHLGAIEATPHAGAPTKCQACRAIHAQMTAGATPITDQPAATETLEVASTDAEQAAG